MFQELKFQLSTAILTLVTLAACASAILNFQQQQKFRLPDDGAIWVDRSAGVEALDVAAAGSAAATTCTGAVRQPDDAEAPTGRPAGEREHGVG